MRLEHDHARTHGVVVFDAGGDGQHQIGEQRVVLEPLMVGHEELNFVGADGIWKLKPPSQQFMLQGFSPKHVHLLNAGLLGGRLHAHSLGHGLLHVWQGRLWIGRVVELLELLEVSTYTMQGLPHHFTWPSVSASATMVRGMDCTLG